MTNATFFSGLPDFDSPTLEQEMETIAASDRENLAKISQLAEQFNWHEKMAIGQVAYSLIDSSRHKLLKLIVASETPDVEVQNAMELVKKLSPQALAELAMDILEEDFEGEIEVGDE